MPLLLKTYRNKTYIAFDADTDMLQYKLLKAWKANDKIEFNFHNAHELNNLRKDSSEKQIKLKLKERLKSTKLMILLVGEKTKNLFKFVRWEIEVAIEMNIPIIVVNLNNNANLDEKLCPPILKKKLALHIKYKQKAITWAIDNWIELYKSFVSKNELDPVVLKPSFYKENGI